jgi:hypothetical protein
MVLAMGSFVGNDTIVKLVGESLPVGEIVTIRGLFCVLILGAICARACCGTFQAWPTAPS